MSLLKIETERKTQTLENKRMRIIRNPDEQQQQDVLKVKYFLFGAALTISLQFCWAYLTSSKGGGKTSHHTKPTASSGSLSVSAAASRTLSPLHHLDFQKLKSRSSSSANYSRSAEQQGESSIFQIVLTGGPSGGKSR